MTAPPTTTAVTAAVSSWELVAAVQAGDRDAFAELYTRYHPMVFRFLLVRVNRDRWLAEDLASETFLRALRGIATVSEQGRDVGAWLVTIARNLLCNHAHAAHTRLEWLTGEVGEPDGGVVAGPEQLVLARETSAALADALAGLTPGQLQCLWLRFGRDLSVRQVAVVMGRAEDAVRCLTHRAVRHLAHHLPQECGVGSW